MRRKCAPRYVALIPQDDEKNANNELVRHNGFRLFYLPCECEFGLLKLFFFCKFNFLVFLANIRNINVFEKEPPTVADEETEIFQKIIKKLKFKYNPSQFENPMLKVSQTSEKNLN